MSDPFATLGLHPAFDIDRSELEAKYRALQKALHPDRFAQAPVQERRMSLERAVRVNEAYRLLKDDLARAKALLALRGVEVSDEPPADPELLMEVMELREELAEARSSQDLAKVTKLGEAIGKRQKSLTEEVTRRFKAEEHGADLQRALGRMRYYRRFLEEVTVIEDEAAEAAMTGG